MIIVLKQDVTKEQLEIIKSEVERNGLSLHHIQGESTRVVGVVGDTSTVHPESFSRLAGIEQILKIQEPYKLASRRLHPLNTVIDVGGHKIGGGNFAVIAGPCSVESEEQIVSIAEDVQKAGAGFLRGGAFKPRSSPYAFQGLGLDGLELLKIAREKTGLPIVTELLSPEYLDAFARDVDVIQIGARNMQNFQLLRQVGRLGKPILLKRGLANTIDELLMAAEYILAEGKSEVILCERGIRTFETATRNTLDLSAIPVLRQRTHLPIIVDPSHATGHWDLVAPMALAAVAAGADGLIIEVHNHPEKALCDGAQSITPKHFSKLMTKINKIYDVVSDLDTDDNEQ